MDLCKVVVSLLMISCIIGVACAATDSSTANLPVRNWGSDGAHGKTATHVGQNVKIANVAINNAATGVKTNAAVTYAGPVTFTGIQTSGNAIDNTKRVAVYMADMSNPIWSESLNGGLGAETTIRVAFDPLTASLLYEYNPTYIGDSNLGLLIPQNYDLLIVPMSQMSTQAATQIQTYINSGGSVWFLNDPCLNPAGAGSVQLTTLLNGGVSASTSSASTITVTNDGTITSGLPASFKPVGTTTKTTEFRTFATPSGVISGLNYQVLMSMGTTALLVKFENPTTGARVIYSNPNMFVSGGTSSYFNAQTGSQLFTQVKAWIMKLSLNQNGVSVTYPKSDKQLTVTCDDVTGADWETTAISPMLAAENTAGVTPKNINTFFVIPESDTSAAQMTYYSNNGDTHTLHPHVTPDGYGYVWDVVGTSLATYMADIATSKGVINKAVSGNAATDYGYTAWRFPMTTYCLNSMQAVSNSGFTIESSTGIGTDWMAPVGNDQDNTILMPKQMLIGNAKSNIMEMEMPAPFDIDSTASGQFYTNNNAFTNQFKGINFPSNFVVGGHYQGIGTGGLTTWGVKVTGLDKELGQVITAEKAAKPNYANFNTLANYLNGVKTASITGTSAPGLTTVYVTNSKPVTDFTLKVALGGVTSATCDGAPCTVTTDSLTGASYVTATIAASPHTFIINTNGGIVPPTPTSPVASFTQTASTGTGSVSVTFASTSTGYPTPTCSWDFGDGSAPATGNSVTHVFTNTGTIQLVRTVTLTATNSVSSSTKTGTVTINPVAAPKPATTFTVSPTTGTIATVFTFTDTTPGTITSRLWTFSDGTTSAAASITHTFATAKTYTVTLTDTNSAGSTPLSKSVVVTGNKAPTASFTYSPTTVKKGTVITFTDTSSQNPTSWKWTFNDNGATVNTKVAKHTFARTGSFNVKLIAYNNVGNGAITKTIRVVN